MTRAAKCDRPRQNQEMSTCFELAETHKHTDDVKKALVAFKIKVKLQYFGIYNKVMGFTNEPIKGCQ